MTHSSKVSAAYNESIGLGDRIYDLWVLFCIVLFIRYIRLLFWSDVVENKIYVLTKKKVQYGV